MARHPATLLLGLALCGPAWADDELAVRAERLAALRAEVATLSAALEGEKEALNGELRAMDAQRVDLEVQVRREQLRIAQLAEELERQRQQVGGSEATDAALRPAVVATLAELRAVVASGVPYRVGERLEALDEIARSLEDGRLAPSQAVGRSWAFVEDELRLCRETALDRQVITLGGREVLVDVARLGMVALYFRAPDGAVGMAERQGDAWTWTVVDGSGRDAILDLFDALARGIRTGWAEVPNALPEVTR